MENVARLPAALQWSEGMLLAPQHLQQHDIYWHAQLRHQLARAQPHYWGVAALALDPEQLARGIVAVTRLHCVLPDGLAIAYPSRGDDPPLRLDLTEGAGLPKGESVRLHVAVHARHENAAREAAPGQRYESLPPELEIDENTGRGAVEVHRMRPKLELLRAADVSARHVALPLAEVRRDPGGGYALTAFHPPLLALDASGFLEQHALQRQLELLTRRAREKARELVGPKDARAARLVAALPPLEVLVGNGRTHPFDVYFALAGLLGQLAALEPGYLPLQPDAYRHDDAEPGFRRLVREAFDLIDRQQAAYATQPFSRAPNGVFEVAIPERTAVDRLLIELKPAEGESPRSLQRWLEQARIGVAPLLPLLAKLRVPGAEARVLDDARAAQLHVPGTGLLVELVNQRIDWRREPDAKPERVPTIVAGKPLCIDGPDAERAPAAVVLYLPRNAPGGGHG